MPNKFQNKYRIESNRWQNWDYSAPGSYFITICIEDREEILGKIANGKMQLSAYGEIVKNEFIQMGNYNERAVLDEWVIMPNHVHCIITLRGTGTAVEKIHEFSLHEFSLHEFSLPSSPPTETDIKQYRRIRRKMMIPLMEGKFKTLTSKQINIMRNTPGRKTWQHDYYEHVIRDRGEYDRIKHYIINNPAKWHDDTFNDENDGRCNDDGDGYGDWRAG
jgi:putative transposase